MTTLDRVLVGALLVFSWATLFVGLYSICVGLVVVATRLIVG